MKYRNGKTNNDELLPFMKEAYQFADRVIALGNRQNPVKDEIAGDWEAGYIFGRIDMKKQIESWVKITSDPNSLPPECTVVLGYSPEWVDEDFEPEGIRECFYNNDEWNSARWNNDQDTWINDDETKPTHWMQRPQSPFTAQ